MDALLRRLARTAVRRGMGGGHWAWFLLAGAAYLLRRARRREDAVTSFDLHEGERYLVRLLDPRAPAAEDAG